MTLPPEMPLTAAQRETAEVSYYLVDLAVESVPVDYPELAHETHRIRSEAHMALVDAARTYEMGSAITLDWWFWLSLKDRLRNLRQDARAERKAGT